MGEEVVEFGCPGSGRGLVRSGCGFRRTCPARDPFSPSRTERGLRATGAILPRARQRPSWKEAVWRTRPRYPHRRSGREAFRTLYPEVPEYEERLQDRGPEEVPVVRSSHRARRAVEAGSGGRSPGSLTWSSAASEPRTARSAYADQLFRRLLWRVRRCRAHDTGYRIVGSPKTGSCISPGLAGKAHSSRRPPGSRPATSLPHRQAHRGLRVPTHHRPQAAARRR